MSKIQYTKTDEAPLLATHSLLPIVKSFCAQVGIAIETVDISLAGRILSQFKDSIKNSDKVNDGLTELSCSVKDPEANIIKLPNISASLSQLKDAITELQSKGFTIPDYPEEVKTDEDKLIQAKYSKALGSAVNPVLREGNSDRRVAPPVKKYAQQNPHELGAWSKDSKTHIAHMSDGDFYSSEKSYISGQPTKISIQLVKQDCTILELKKPFDLLKGEVIDASVLSKNKLVSFFEKEIKTAKEDEILLSVHLKATMMKVSDPIIFGHAVETFFAPVFEKYKSTFTELKVDANNGLSDLYKKLEKLPQDLKSEITKMMDEVYRDQPDLAMVNADKGITNLHVPSDIIIDSSIPAAIKSSGQMWGPDNKLHDTRAVVPDRCYAGIYQTIIDYLKENGAFNVKTMGSVSNVGLMAFKAEEYGSHDKTFEMKDSGKVQVIDENKKVIFEHQVEKGDIWRMCQTKNIAIEDWVKLAIRRSSVSKTPAIFWLDSNRAHDRNLIRIVNQVLESEDTLNSQIEILDPDKAMTRTLERVSKGKDTISVTGNVLRDYLTDLFPILELGTSAKMLSIVPLIKGGGLYETGAGGSAPKHVEQLIEENHLRWDSLGEFLAIAVSLEELGQKTGSKKIQILASGLEYANNKLLENDKSPSRKCGEIDNRGSHFYLSLYWSEFLANQNDDEQLKKLFSEVYDSLSKNTEKIDSEMIDNQGHAVDIKGYYWPDEKALNDVMRPSPTYNKIIDNLYEANPI